VRIRFGECEFDAARRCLLRAGRPRPLPPKAFLLLDLLLERRPAVVSKQELMERLWPDTYVSDGSLHALVANLRNALGDDSGEPRLLRTVARVGYAFEAEAWDAGPSVGAVGGHYLVWGERELPLLDGVNVLGRERDCTARVDAATVSRHHARIVIAEGQAIIEDLGSKNGTFVGRSRLSKPAALSDGDEVRLGSIALVYHRGGALPSTQTGSKA